MAYIGSNPRQIPLIKEIGVGLPVGAIVEFPINKVSAGFLRTTGEKYNPITFPALYEVLKSDTLPFRGHDTKLGGVKWFNSRSEIDPDFVPADGQALANGFSLYPDLLLLVSTGKVPTTDDTKWKADPTMRGCFTTTTSGNEIRVPDYNGKSEGSLGAVVLRGDGKNAANPGVIQGDAIRNITGSMIVMSHRDWVDHSANYWAGCLDKPTTIGQVYPSTANELGRMIQQNFNASLSVPTAPENRMVNTAGCWGVRVQVSTEFAIKVFDNITPEGLVEVAGLVQENIELRQAVDALAVEHGSNARGSWIKYPDGKLECTMFYANKPTNMSPGTGYSTDLLRYDFIWEFPHPFKLGGQLPITSGDMRDNTSSGFFAGSVVDETSEDYSRYARMVYVTPNKNLIDSIGVVKAVGCWK